MLDTCSFLHYFGVSPSRSRCARLQAEAWRVAQEAETRAEELGLAVEASAAALAEDTARRGEERAALAAKLAQAERSFRHARSHIQYVY